MDGAADRKGAGPDRGQDLALELERKRLALRVLLEISRELSGMLQPRKIVETFLLTAMGPLGAVRGVAVLARPASGEGLVVSRGLPASVAEALEARVSDICDAYFPYRDLDSEPPVSKIRAIRRDAASGDGLLPRDMDILLSFPVDEEHCGLLALGPRLAPLAKTALPGLDDDESDLLHSLVHILVGVLRGALAVNSIRQLSADLGRKNERLSEALNASQTAKVGLDRRVHQLAVVNALAGDLAHLQTVPGILGSFLLTMLGAFSVTCGLALVLDRSARSVDLAVRGAPDPGLASFDAADALVYKAFAASEARSVAPLTVEPVAGAASALSGCGLGFEPSCAVYFALSQEVQGVLVLGGTISGEALWPEDEQLLRAQAATLLGYVQGARHLATITALNEDLVRRNEELTRTISELTEARQTIDVLERAGERVRSFLRAEAMRSRRFSWLDCAVITLASVLLALLFNLASPKGVPLVPEHLRRPPALTVTAQKARELQQSEGAVVVDARPKAFFDQRRIRGALNLTPALFDMVYIMRFAELPPGTPIIVYGGNISRRWDEDVAWRLMARDHERVVVLEDGLAAWSGRGYPVEP